MKIGSKLRAFRRSVGLTQRELASRSDLSSGYLGLLELDSRHPERDKLVRLCEALGLTFAEADQLLLDAGYRPLSEGESPAFDKRPSTLPAKGQSALLEVTTADTGKASARPVAPEVLKPLGPFKTTDGRFSITICREHHADRNFVLIQDLTGETENVKITLVSNGPNGQQLVAQGYITNGNLALSVDCEIKLPISWLIKTESQEKSEGEAP